MEIHPHPNPRFLPVLERSEPINQDHSAMILAMACWRKYFYRIVLGRVPKVNGNQIFLDWGTHYHKFREILELENYGNAMKYIIGAKLPASDKKKYLFLDNVRLVKSCQVAYEHWLREKEQKKFEVIAVEQPFNIQLQDDLFISGRADQIVKWGGKIWGRDFKTTTKDIAYFTRGLDPNDQVTRYIVGESAIHGQPIEGIIIEVMQNQSESSKPTIHAIPVSRNLFQLNTWKAEQLFLNKMLEMCRTEDIWPMQPHNCGWCEFHIVCKQTSERSMIDKLKTDFVYSPWDSTLVHQEIIDL